MSNARPDKDLARKAPFAVRHITYDVFKDTRVTPKIDTFVRGGIVMRATILALMLFAADHLKPKMRVLDVGAGDAPYRELFKKQEYKTTDFAGTKYHAYKHIDYVCPAHDIPVADNSFDAILCTEVLEHVPNPVESIHEFHRVLKKGGQLFITVPFMISIHEIPYDFLRYTPFYFEKVLKEAGFAIEFISPRGGIFSVMASFLLGIEPKPQKKGLKNFLVYFFIFLPLYIIPVMVLRHGYARLAFIVDNAMDPEQINTPGYAVYAIKK